MSRTRPGKEGRYAGLWGIVLTNGMVTPRGRNCCAGQVWESKVLELERWEAKATPGSRYVRKGKNKGGSKVLGTEPNRNPRR